jgi:hypothetical protein
MAAGQGNKIEWSDYNAIQSVIAPVLGSTPTASGTTGYGQSVASNPVSQFAKITNTQWANLRTDILRARQHQTGTDLTSTLAVPYFEITVTQTATNTNLLTTASTSQLAVNCPVIFIGTSLIGGVQAGVTYYVKTIESSTTFTISTTEARLEVQPNNSTLLIFGPTFSLSTGIGSMVCRFGGTKITETDRAAYKALADTASTNKLVGVTGASSIPATQSTRETLYNDRYIDPWNGLLSVVSTVQFTSYDAARYFFNSRGQIEITSSRTGGSGGLKNATWTTMLDSVAGMGIIYFTYNATVNKLTNGNPGFGTASALGFYNLTTSDQLLFERLAPSGAYADNKFRIFAKLIDGNGGAGSNSCIQFTLQWRDESSNPNPVTYGTFGPFGVDEEVNGIISSIIQMLRPTGSNVSISAPTANIVNNFTVSSIAPNTISYTITPSISTTNEGTTVTYTITTTNLANGSIIYWTNNGTTVAADFTDGVNSGSVTINNNSASIVRSVTNDALTDGPETLQLILRTGSTAGPIVASASSVNVNDTSLTPIGYSIVSNITGRYDEGTTITYTVTTENFGNGTLFWNNIGTTVAADFTDGANSGSVPIANNSGTFTRTVKNDVLTEGDETVIMTLRVGSVGGTTVATSGTVTVNDSSTTLLPLYAISTTLNSNAGIEDVNEGETFILSVDTNPSVPSSPIYWAWSGIAAADLGLPSLSGVMSITPGTISSKTFTVRADGLTEGTETANLNFYKDAGLATLLTSQSVGGTVTGNSRTIRISDTSQNLTVGPASLTTLTSGSNFSTTFTATGGSGIYSFGCSLGNLPPGTILDSGGTLSGTVTCAGPYSFVISAKDSNNVLGSNSYSGNIVANESVSAPTGTLKQTDLWYVVITNATANDTFRVSIDGSIYGEPTQVNAQGRFQGAYTQSAGTRTYTLLFTASGNTRSFSVTTTKVVCTAMNEAYGFGSFRNRVWLKYSETNLTKAHEVGYHTIFLPLVDYAYKSGTSKPKSIVRNMLEHIARHRTVDLRAQLGNRKRDSIGRLYRTILEPLCYVVGSIVIAIGKLKK